MSEQIEKVYGPGLHHLSRLGYFMNIILWFYPLIIHETADGIVVYKMRKGIMYVFGVMKKPTQSDKAAMS